MDYGAFREIVEHARRKPEAIGLVVKAWARLPDELKPSALDLARRRLDVLLVWDDLLTLGDAVEWCVLAMGEEVSEDQTVSVAWWLGSLPDDPFDWSSVGLGASILYFEDTRTIGILWEDTSNYAILGRIEAAGMGNTGVIDLFCPYLTDECLAPWLQRGA